MGLQEIIFNVYPGISEWTVSDQSGNKKES